MAVRLVPGLTNRSEPFVRKARRILVVESTSRHEREIAQRRQVSVYIVIQVPVLVAYVGDRQNGLGAERMLNAGTVLRAGRWFVTVDVQTSDIRRLDGLERGRSTGRKQDVGVL